MDKNHEVPREIEELLAKQRKTKKAITIASVIIAAAVVILIIALSLPNFFEANDTNTDDKGDGPSYIFYPQDYDEDIYKNSEYMSRNRYIMFKNLETGVTEDINNLTDDKYLAFMAELVNSIIEGDADKYNSMFSEEYLKKNADTVRERFTMQMLYDIVVARHYTESGTVYSLEYKIMKNNGSYRSDMPSDCSKAQYFVISEHNGKLLIDGLAVSGR